ncbi:MAG: hypothetical protein QM765_32220 [Myxococcales bacterium]
MRIRYRILTSELDSEEMANVARSIADDARLDHPLKGLAHEREGRLAGSVQALLETPLEVSDHTGEAEVERVAELIDAGEMKPHDLVNPGDGWREARDFQPLAEACERAEAKERARRMKLRAFWVVFAIAAVAVMAFMLERLSRV